MATEKPIASSPIRQSPGSLAPLYKALAGAQGEYPPIEKRHIAKVMSKDNSSKLLYTYTYADLADIMGPTRPVLAKHGLSVQHLPLMRGDAMVVVCRLAHETGQWIEAEYPVSGIGGNINHQTLGGALAYAKRQSYCAVTGIVAEEEGDESDVEDGKEVPAGEQRAEEPKPAAAPPRRTPKAKPAVESSDPIVAEMLRMTTPESLKEWHTNAADRIQAQTDEWRDDFYARYDDHMATLKAKHGT